MVTAALQRQSPPSAAKPMREDLDASVRALGAEFKARAASTETTATVPVESVEALRALGFFKLVQPQAYRGYEADFEHLVDLTIEIGRSCASTAWVCGLLAAHQWLVAGFPAEAQHDVWGQKPRCADMRFIRSGHEGARRSGWLPANRKMEFRQWVRQFQLGSLRRIAATP